MGKYEELHKLSRENPDKFWGDIAENFHWYKKWDKVLDDSNPPFYKWFTGGETNTCYNAVDRWVETKKDQAAYIWESPETDQSRDIIKR